MRARIEDSFARTWRRLDGVDLLRGLAILLVLLNHVNMRLVIAHIPYGAALPAPVLAMLVWNGEHGVQMFFAISGFLITATSLRRWGDLGRVRVLDFYRLRFARIAPLLLLLLLALSVLDRLHLQDFVVGGRTGGLGAALLAALSLRVNVLEARHGYLPGSWDVLWSLSVEETFYLFFPLLCRLIGGSKRLFVAVMLIFVALGPIARALLTQGNEIWHEYSYLGGMDAIALGCLTALALHTVHLKRRARWNSGLIGAAALAFALMFTLPSLARAGLDMSIVAIGTCLTIAALGPSGWRAPLPLRALTGLGQRSYEIYLTHMFIVFALFHAFLRAGKPAYGPPLLFATVIVLAGVAGALTARFYSEPLNRRLRARWQRARADFRAAVSPPSAIES
jgi:peptidoglycan/LPS O-acetylase OafA/YrhL